MGKVYIGTSGYSYKDWRGPFYPEDLESSQFLPYYAGHFPFVELNFSYYGQPNRYMLKKIADKTPKGFLFSIKGHKSFTHERKGEWKTEATTFREEVSPLVDENIIAAVLLQFPYSFHYTPDNREYLASLSEALSGLPLAVEFRNNEWQHDEVYDGMKKRGIASVCTDGPDVKNLPKPTAVATADIGYVRFHGRNAKNWWQGDNTTRYDYLYSEDELSEWLDRIVTLINATKVLFIAFNNHHKGQAVQNGRMLTAMLNERDIPFVRPVQ